MFRFSIFLFFLFFHPCISIAQPSDFKLLKKNKFEKVEKRTNKKIIKNPDDCEVLYTIGVLYNSEGYSKFNPETGLKKINEAMIIFVNLDIKTKDKLTKNGSGLDSMLVHKNNSFDLGLEIAKSSPSVESFQHFIDVFHESYTQKNEAITLRDIYAFRIAKIKNTEEGYIPKVANRILKS